MEDNPSNGLFDNLTFGKELSDILTINEAISYNMQTKIVYHEKVAPKKVKAVSKSSKQKVFANVMLNEE